MTTSVVGNYQNSSNSGGMLNDQDTDVKVSLLSIIVGKPGLYSNIFAGLSYIISTPVGGPQWA